MNQLDNLIENKMSGARSARMGTVIVTVIAILALLGVGAYGVSRALSQDATLPTPSKTPTGTTAPSEVDNPDVDPFDPEGIAQTTPTESANVEPSTGAETLDTTIAHTISIAWANDLAPREPVTVTVQHGANLLHEFSLTETNGWRVEWEDEYEASELTLMGDFPTGSGATFTVSGADFQLSGNYTGDNGVIVTTDPAAATDPAEGTEPTETADPAETTEPTESTASTDPAEITEPTETTDPAETTGAGETTDPAQGETEATGETPTETAESGEGTETTETTPSAESGETAPAESGQATDLVTPSPDEPLPQTGLAWWPIPLFLFAGMLLLVAAWRSKKQGV